MVDTPDPAPQADEPSVPEETKEEIVETSELSPEQQEEKDALLQVNGDIKGEVKANRPLDESAPIEGELDADTEDVTEDTAEEETTPEEAEAEVATPAVEPEEESEKDETGVYASPTTTDPGDFKPGDYSFTVQTTDGKTHKISTPEDAEAFASQLDTNPELISASQFLALGRKTNAMEQGISADKRSYDQVKEQHDLEASQAETRQQYLNQWQSEVNYLRQKGDLPPITDELNRADWTDPKVSEEPGVKETIALYKWMEEENNKRMAAGLPPDLSVVSANSAMQLEAMRSAEKEELQTTKSRNRSRGAMVTGKSPYVPGNSPKGTLIGEAKGLEQLASEAYYADRE